MDLYFLSQMYNEWQAALKEADADRDVVLATVTGIFITRSYHWDWLKHMCWLQY